MSSEEPSSALGRKPAPTADFRPSVNVLDQLRARLYRVFAPVLRPFIANRALRVDALGLFSVVTSLLMTWAAPLWLLALGPLVLGVPHLMADARYLVAQPGLHRHGVLSWLLFLPLVGIALGAPPFVGLLAMVPAVLLADARFSLKLAALGGWLALTAAAFQFENSFLLAFLHLHNLIALAFWWAWRPREARSLVVPLLVVVALLFFFLGGADAAIARPGPATGTTFTEFVASNAPGLPPIFAARLVLSFAFMQSLHYGVWLRLVPDDARARPAPRPFAASWRALERDLGRPLLLVCCGATVVIAAWGAVNLAQARDGYLRLASFHGYLELAAGAYFLVQQKRPVPC